MTNKKQDPQNLDEAWNDFVEAKIRLLQSMLDFVHAAQKDFDSHIWIVLGYPDGMKGWTAYCRDNFGQQATIMKQLPKSDRRQLLLEAKSTGLSDRSVAKYSASARQLSAEQEPTTDNSREDR